MRRLAALASIALLLVAAPTVARADPLLVDPTLAEAAADDDGPRVEGPPLATRFEDVVVAPAEDGPVAWELHYDLPRGALGEGPPYATCDGEVFPAGPRTIGFDAPQDLPRALLAPTTFDGPAPAAGGGHAVPEPAVLSLLVGAVVVLLLARRR